MSRREFYKAYVVHIRKREEKKKGDMLDMKKLVKVKEKNTSALSMRNSVSQ